MRQTYDIECFRDGSYAILFDHKLLKQGMPDPLRASGERRGGNFYMHKAIALGKAGIEMLNGMEEN